MLLHSFEHISPPVEGCGVNTTRIYTDSFAYDAYTIAQLILRCISVPKAIPLDPCTKSSAWDNIRDQAPDSTRG
jgi:hypothetical protein